MTRLAHIGPVESERGKPLYASVRDAILASIDSGSFAPGDQLPSTKALSESLDVSLVTVHRALGELVDAGVLERGQGRGTFVHKEYFARGRQGTATRFGLVFHGECSLADSYHGQIVEGVRREAAEHAVDLVLLRYGEDWRRECQGYLYVNPTDEQLERSPRFGSGDRAMHPTMIVGASTSRDGFSFVDTDNIAIGARAVEHLASLGHTRIGYVGDASPLSNSQDRWHGFVRACDSLNIEVSENRVLRANSWALVDDEVERLRELLAYPSAPTAIVAAGYYLALGVYSATKRSGLSIPDDLAVVGVDDPPSAAYLSPSLTTTRQPLIEVGKRAVRELMGRIADPAIDPVRITLQPEMVIRDSTQPGSDEQGTAGH